MLFWTKDWKWKWCLCCAVSLLLVFVFWGKLNNNLLVFSYTSSCAHSILFRPLLYVSNIGSSNPPPVTQSTSATPTPVKQPDHILEPALDDYNDGEGPLELVLGRHAKRKLSGGAYTGPVQGDNHDSSANRSTSRHSHKPTPNKPAQPDLPRILPIILQDSKHYFSVLQDLWQSSQRQLWRLNSGAFYPFICENNRPLPANPRLPHQK